MRVQKNYSKFFKANKFITKMYLIAFILSLINICIDFNVWVLLLAIMFLLKIWDIKDENKLLKILDDYATICTKQSDMITDLSLKLNVANDKIKEFEDKKTVKKATEKTEEKKFTEKKAATKKTTTKKTTTKKTATKKTTTAKKPVKKETKKDD